MIPRILYRFNSMPYSAALNDIIPCLVVTHYKYNNTLGRKLSRKSEIVFRLYFNLNCIFHVLLEFQKGKMMKYSDSDTLFLKLFTGSVSTRY